MTNIYQSTNTDQITGVYNTFDLTKKSNLDLDFSISKSFNGTLRGLWVYLSGAASSPTTITIMITKDVTGDDILIPVTTSAISYGLSTNTKGVAAFAVNLPLILRNQENVYLFCRTDTGTITIDKVIISWDS